MSYLWGGMILMGIIYGVCAGNSMEVTQAVIDSSKEAVSLCLGMAGITAFWSGLMKIAEEAGIVAWLTKRIRPLLRFLFPRLNEKGMAMKYIAVNMIANFLGMGLAATPAGLRAMEELKKEEDGRRKMGMTAWAEGTASNEMCSFLIINISSLQLIPVTMSAYRSQYGSANPAGIVVPGILATTVSTLAGIAYCKWKDRRKR